MARPNILYLHTHDTGRFVSPYGAPVPTPRLQRFAEEGVLFSQAFSAAPTCSPSRAALLTGQAPHSAGMMGLAHWGFGLTEPRQHLAHTLAAAGYHTAMVGQQHVTDPLDPAELGYAELLPSSGPRAAELLPGVLDFLGRGHDRPFFLSVGLFETHTMPDGGGTFGYPGDDDRYVAPPAGLPSTAETRSDIASFRAAGVGGRRRVRADPGRHRRGGSAGHDPGGDHHRPRRGPARDEGHADRRRHRRVVDHAWARRLRRWPAVRVPGLPDRPVPDLLRAAAGSTGPAWLQGRSLLPAVRDGREVNEVVFTESTYHVSYQPQRCVRNRRWSYLRDFSDWHSPRLANVDDSASKDLWVSAGWADSPVPAERLHDLVLDPLERVNLVDDPAYADVLADLRTRLAEWMRQTDDPLLAGPVPHPPGHPPLPDDALSPS